MYITKKHLSRRTVLRGMGATLALPLLEAMVPAGTALAKTAAAGRTRLSCIEMVHGSAGATVVGTARHMWSPATAGRAFDLTPTSLLPLEPYRDHLTIVSNTDVRMAEAFSLAEIGGDHFRSSAVFLTQAHPRQTQGSDVFVGPSMDQLYAQRFGQDTPIPSMQLCIENVDQSGGCAYGYACVYTDTISWATATQPLPMVRDPRAAFDQLFGVGATPEERAAHRRTDRSILDWMTAQVEDVRRRLGPGDRARLNEYLDDVREIERRIQRIEAHNVSGEPRELPEAPIGVPDDFEEHVRLMFDLQAVAFASDLTRVFSFKMSRDSTSRVYPNSGVNVGFHPASHHQGREDRVTLFADINTYHVGMLPYFIEKLKNTPDGDGTLLDNSLIIYGSPMGDSNVHNHKRCPLILLGHAGGRLKGRLHIMTPDGTPMANAMLTMLHMLGLDDTDSFGDSTAAMDLNSAGRVTVETQNGRRAPAPHAAGAPGSRGARRSEMTRVGRRIGQIIGGAGVVLLAAAVSWAAGDPAPVAEAAMARDHTEVRELLRRGGDVNAAQGDGMTALHWAAYHGDRQLADMLLQAGANPRATTRIAGSTPLALAAEHGHAGVVGVLLAAGADVEAIDATGTTALMLAAASGDATAVRLLLEHGADVHARERAKDQTALMFAAAFNRVDALEVLLAHGADPAATSKVVDLVALSEASPGTGRGGAAGAAGRDRPYRYHELVGTQGGVTALHLAARDGHKEAVRLLLEAGADINQAGAGDRTTPLLIAVINGHFDLAREMIARGADVGLASEGGVTPLYAALNVQWAPRSMYPQPRAHLQQRTSYLDLMTLLIDRGADVNARVTKKVWYSGYNTDMSGVDETGATPFWRAAYASDVEAMRLLVAHGADPQTPTIRPPGRPRYGEQPDVAAEVADLSGLPPVPVGGPGVPPLLAASGVGYGGGFAANTHHYAPTGFLPAIRYLVEEMGADVNAVDHEGNTALHHAAARGDNESILFLVSHGADVTRVNRDGMTTADMANGPVQRVQPFPDTLALLMKLGATNNDRCVSC